jgi:hypothetical protein
VVSAVRSRLFTKQSTLHLGIVTAAITSTSPYFN